jgi:hypothetical protein
MTVLARTSSNLPVPITIDAHTPPGGYPTYLPDLAMCDFFLSPTTKNHLKGSRFGIVEEILKAMKPILNNLQEIDFWRSFEIWKQR